MGRRRAKNILRYLDIFRITEKSVFGEDNVHTCRYYNLTEKDYKVNLRRLRKGYMATKYPNAVKVEHIYHKFIVVGPEVNLREH